MEAAKMLKAVREGATLKQNKLPEAGKRKIDITK